MNNDKNKDFVFIAILLLTVVFAAFLRIPFLGISPLDYDEGFTVFYSSQSLFPWSKFMAGAVAENYYPPLDFLLHHFAYSIFGISENTIRYVPCFFDLLTVLFFGLLGKKLCGRLFGIFCSLLWAISPTAIYYAMQARLYSQFCFAFILMLYAFACYKSNRTLFTSIFLIITIIYGFNVHLLFICALPIAVTALLIDYGLSYPKNSLKKIIIHIASLCACICISFLFVYLFYKFYKIFTTVVTTPTDSNYSLYSIKELLQKLILRIYDSIYAESICSWGNLQNRGTWIIWILLSLFVISLFNKKDIFVKALIVLSFLSIPFFDTLIIYKGHRFTGRNDIRFVYWFVPMIWLCLAYSFLLIYNFLCYLVNRILKKEHFIITIILMLISFSCIFLFDHYLVNENRYYVQKFIKNRYWNFKKWIVRNSNNKKIDFYIVFRKYEWRAYDYINVLDYPGKTNVNCKVLHQFNPNIFKNNQVYDSIIKDYLSGERILAIVLLDEKFPWDKKLFKLIDLGVEKVYIFLPPTEIDYDNIKKYEDIFGTKFIGLFSGKKDDYSSLTNQFVIQSQYIDMLPKNIILNGNFKDGLKEWSYTDSVDLFETNGINAVCISGSEGKQKRIWQTINVVSGKTYRLSFDLVGPSKGAFSIFRDIETGKEIYYWCNSTNKKRRFMWNIKANKSGKHIVFLSTSKTGKFYYSDISFVESSE